MNQAYLFVDTANHTVSLVRIPTSPEGGEPEGQIYEHAEMLHDMVSVVLDVSHGDADGILMAAEMQGRDWVLEPIDGSWYVTMRRVPELCTEFPRTLDLSVGGRDEPLLERVRAAIAVKASETRQ